MAQIFIGFLENLLLLLSPSPFYSFLLLILSSFSSFFSSPCSSFLPHPYFLWFFSFLVFICSLALIFLSSYFHFRFVHLSGLDFFHPSSSSSSSFIFFLSSFFFFFSFIFHFFFFFFFSFFFFLFFSFLFFFFLLLLP